MIFLVILFLVVLIVSQLLVFSRTFKNVLKTVKATIAFSGSTANLVTVLDPNQQLRNITLSAANDSVVTLLHSRDATFFDSTLVKATLVSRGGGYVKIYKDGGLLTLTPCPLLPPLEASFQQPNPVWKTNFLSQKSLPNGGTSTTTLYVPYNGDIIEANGTSIKCEGFTVATSINSNEDLTTNLAFQCCNQIQFFKVPANIHSINVSMWGAAGGGGGSASGAGAYVKGILQVTPGQTLLITVGQGGINNANPGYGFPPKSAYGGGGPGSDKTDTSNYGLAGGGGRSAIGIILPVHIVSATSNGGSFTFTTSDPHNLSIGFGVKISNMNPEGYNVTGLVTLVSERTFSVVNAAQLSATDSQRGQIYLELVDVGGGGGSYGGGSQNSGSGGILTGRNPDNGTNQGGTQTSGGRGKGNGLDGSMFLGGQGGYPYGGGGNGGGGGGGGWFGGGGGDGSGNGGGGGSSYVSNPLFTLLDSESSDQPYMYNATGQSDPLYVSGVSLGVVGAVNGGPGLVVLTFRGQDVLSSDKSAVTLLTSSNYSQVTDNGFITPLYNVPITNGYIDVEISSLRATPEENEGFMIFTPPAAPSFVNFVAMGSQFFMANVSEVENADTYTLKLYSNSTRSSTGGSLIQTFTKGSTDFSLINLGGSGELFTGSPNYFYMKATCSNERGESFETTSKICTFYGFSGSTVPWTAPENSTATICLTGGGATNNGGGNGGMMVCSYNLEAGTTYNITVGGGSDRTGDGTAFGAGGVTGGTGFYAGGSMSQFHTDMIAGGGGASGTDSSGTYGVGGRGGNGGTFGLNGTNGNGQDGKSGTTNQNSEDPKSSGFGRGATTTHVGSGGAQGGVYASDGNPGLFSQGGNGGEDIILGISNYLPGSGGGAGYFGGGGSGGVGGQNFGGVAGGAGGGSSYVSARATVLNTVDFAVGAYIASNSPPFNGLAFGLAEGQGAGGGACAIIW